MNFALVAIFFVLLSIYLCLNDIRRHLCRIDDALERMDQE